MSTVMARTARKARTATTPHPRAERPKRASDGSVPSAPPLLLLVGVLCVIGIVMVGTASPMISILNGGTSFSILERELLWMVLGLTTLAVTARFDYRRWRALALPVLGLAVAALVLVFMPGVGSSAGGATRWINFGPLSLQPSELAKLGLVLVVAEVLTRRADRTDQPRMQIGPVVIILACTALPVFVQPDLGTTIVLACIAFGTMFMAGVRLWPLTKLIGVVSLAGLAYALHSGYQRQRIFSFLHPQTCAKSTCYQVWQSLLGLGSGHAFGLGLGGSHAAWGVLPNAQTDFIFSVAGEQFGFAGALVIVSLFFALAWCGFRVALRAPDRFGSLVAAGITTWIIAQAAINIGAVIGAMPVTGIPLPFVSFGGTSLVITLGAVGILMNIAACGDAVAESPQVTPLAARRRRVARA